MASARMDSQSRCSSQNQTESDSCLYLRRMNDSFAYILIDVDDMIILTKTTKEFQSILKALQEQCSVAFFSLELFGFTYNNT